MKNFVIGDLQGCACELEQLLKKLDAFEPASHLIFVGDVVNRGPAPLTTLRKVRSLGNRAKAVLGNHDLHLLAVAAGIRPLHSSDTFADILHAPDREELLQWLRFRPLALMEKGCLVVHAGVLPQWSIQRILEVAAEVESVLRSDHWRDFLQYMYGNSPARWKEDLQGADRLRCIVNALTRMRYCLADGTMVFGEPQTQEEKETWLPWFDLPDRRTEDITIAFGHWSMLGLMIRPNLLGLDTGCVWGGKLTAICLEDRSLVQVECPQHQKPD